MRWSSVRRWVSEWVRQSVNTSVIIAWSEHMILMKLGHKLHIWCLTKVYWPHQNMRTLRGSTRDFLTPPPNPLKIGICFVLQNYTHNFDETWPQPSSPMMYQSVLTASKSENLRSLRVFIGGMGGWPPKEVFALFSETTHTILMKLHHNLHHP